MSDLIDVQVVIVGGGPIGLTLSYILGKNNINHVLLEQNETTSKWPKSIITNTRSMELYHRLGLDKALREKALPGGLQLNISTSLINKPPMLCVPLLQIVGRNPYKQKDGKITFEEQWTTEAPCRLSQIFMEPIIKTEASKFKSCEIKFGWKVQSISQTKENVQVEAVDVKSGERKLYRVCYAIGCDGGKSFVRKSLGIQLKGDFNVAHFQSVAFHSSEFTKKFTSDCLLTVLTKPGFFGPVMRLDEHGLFVAHCVTPKDIKINAENLIKSLMDNEDVPFTIVFENEWLGHFVAAETLQDGRIFLAGDSGHIVIPVGGFGMNIGILDAYDLGWKLVATINGWGGEKLLSSYTIERLYVVQKMSKRIRRLFVLLRRYSPIVGYLASTFPFKYIARLFIDPMNIIAGVTGIMFGIRLETSPLFILSNLPVPRADLCNYTQVAYPGCRAPHFQFQDNTTLYDKLGVGFTLLHLQPSTQNVEPFVAAAAQYGIPLKVISSDDGKLKKLYRGMDFVIIRPDLYMAWCGNEIPTLLHNDDVNEGARMLLKVITGAEELPDEWRQKEKFRSKISTVCAISVIASLIGISAASYVFLCRNNYFK